MLLLKLPTEFYAFVSCCTVTVTLQSQPICVNVTNSACLCECYKVDIVHRCNRAPMKAYEYVKGGEPTLENPDLVISDSDSHK